MLPAVPSYSAPRAGRPHTGSCTYRTAARLQLTGGPRGTAPVRSQSHLAGLPSPRTLRVAGQQKEHSGASLIPAQRIPKKELKWSLGLCIFCSSHSWGQLQGYTSMLIQAFLSSMKWNVPWFLEVKTSAKCVYSHITDPPLSTHSKAVFFFPDINLMFSICRMNYG